MTIHAGGRLKTLLFIWCLLTQETGALNVEEGIHSVSPGWELLFGLQIKKMHGGLQQIYLTEALLFSAFGQMI